MEKFSNVNELVNTLKPVNPVYCIRPETIKNSIKIFKEKFPGKVLYAVKTNPNEFIIKNIIKNGHLIPNIPSLMMENLPGKNVQQVSLGRMQMQMLKESYWLNKRKQVKKKSKRLKQT